MVIAVLEERKGVNFMTNEELFDRVNEIIDNMSTEEFLALVEDCEKNPEVSLFMSEETTFVEKLKRLRESDRL